MNFFVVFCASIIALATSFPAEEVEYDMSKRNEHCTDSSTCPQETCHGKNGTIACSIHHGHGICHCYPDHSSQEGHCNVDTDCSLSATCGNETGTAICLIHHIGNGVCHCNKLHVREVISCSDGTCEHLSCHPAQYICDDQNMCACDPDYDNTNHHHHTDNSNHHGVLG